MRTDIRHSSYKVRQWMTTETQWYFQIDDNSPWICGHKYPVSRVWFVFFLLESAIRVGGKSWQRSWFNQGCVFSGDIIGKEDQRRWGCLQRTKNNKWWWIRNRVWMKMRTWGDEEHWKRGKVNGLEVTVKLKNCWQRGNQISEQESNKVLEKQMIETEIL